MRNMKRKLKSVSPYNIEEFESWLSYNAEKGLFLRTIGKVFCTFEKREPKKMEYRVDISFGGSLYDKNILYKDAGWEFVDESEKAHVYCSSSESKAIEVYTDNGELGILLSTLAKKQIFYGVSLLAFFIALYTVILVIISRSEFPYLNLIGSIYQGKSLNFVVFSLFLGIIISLNYFVMFNKIRKLKIILGKGGNIDHHKKWKKKISFESILPIINIFIIILPVLSPVISYVYSVSDLGVDNNKNILINISEVESDLISHSKTVQNDFSLLCSEIYSCEENATVKEKPFNVNIGLEYYDVRFDFLAKGLVEDLVKENEKFHELYLPETNLNVQELPSEFFDKIYYLENQNSSEFFVRKDKVVAHISYSGTQTKENFLKKLENSIN